MMREILFGAWRLYRNFNERKQYRATAGARIQLARNIRAWCVRDAMRLDATGQRSPRWNPGSSQSRQLFGGVYNHARQRKTWPGLTPVRPSR